MTIPFEFAVVGMTLTPKLRLQIQKSTVYPAGLVELLSAANGFYAFDRALLVRPFYASAIACIDTLDEWNHHDCWRGKYDFDTTDMTFFAEDLFGEQFALRGDHVYRFNPESGESTHFALGIPEFLQRIAADPSVEVGFGLARNWIRLHGPLQPGERLLPKVPFVLGGAYTIGNLHQIRDREGMLFRAEIANQIQNVPDGGTVRLIVSNNPNSPSSPKV